MRDQIGHELQVAAQDGVFRRDDLYLVVNQGWDYDNGRLSRSTSEIILKAAATFRF